MLELVAAAIVGAGTMLLGVMVGYAIAKSSYEYTGPTRDKE